MTSSEHDPNGYQQHEAGAKFDGGKVPVMQGVIKQFPRALIAVAALSAQGAEKYQWNGWESVPDAADRYADAQMRHELYLAAGEEFDPESGFHHLVAVAWNALLRLEVAARTGLVKQ